MGIKRRLLYESEDEEGKSFVVGREDGLIYLNKHPPTFATNSMESSGKVTLECPTIAESLLELSSMCHRT